MIEKAKNMCRSLIGERVSVSDVEIDSAIEQVMYMPFFSGLDTIQLKNELLSTYRSSCSPISRYCKLTGSQQV